MNSIRKIYIENDNNDRFARLEYNGVVLNNVSVSSIMLEDDVYDRQTIAQLFLSNGIEIPADTPITNARHDFDGDIMLLVRPEKKEPFSYHNAWYKIFRKQRV